MDIIFNPPVNEANKYIAIVVDALEESGYHVHPLDSFFSGLRHFSSIRLIHLNWFENLDDSSYSKMIVSFLRKSFVLTVIRLSNKKLVWTMHNRASHEKKSGKLSRILTKKLIKYADAIIIHCSQSRDLLLENHPTLTSKIHYLPHPDFIESYGPVVEKTEKNGKLKLLFLGVIKPYKNIELLIRTVGKIGDKLELTIAGNPKSENYRQQLCGLAGNSQNIKLRLEFIPDRDIPKLIGESDLLVLPYDLSSSLNSGTVLLAFSYSRSVICPEIGTLTDMKEMQDQFMSYKYVSEEEHGSKLTELLESAYEMKMADPEVFKNMGNNMFQYVKRYHDKALVTDWLKQVYQLVLNS